MRKAKKGSTVENYGDADITPGLLRAIACDGNDDSQLVLSPTSTLLAKKARWFKSTIRRWS